MVARDLGSVFTTDQVARMVGLEPKDKWRVIKFAQSNEYGINPTISDADGSGSRRLYDLENICEIALALRLLETGLRSMVIGKVIRQSRKQGKLSDKLDAEGKGTEKLFLVILRAPQTGKQLDEKREQLVEWVSEGKQAEDIRQQHPNCDLILIPMRSLFVELSRAAAMELSRRLKRLQSS
jgi:DNA-binding transcriptional MerR regulator